MILHFLTVELHQNQFSVSSEYWIYLTKNNSYWSQRCVYSKFMFTIYHYLLGIEQLKRKGNFNFFFINGCFYEKKMQE